jgi:uncharacterized membrane protein YbhN (UPF0104 family)
LEIYLWPLLGVAAAALTLWLLFTDSSLNRFTAADVYHYLRQIPIIGYVLAFCSTLVAYGALAWYDRIAIRYIGRKLPWRFTSLVALTSYALGHNIGASAVSGAVIRYRAYSTKGLGFGEIGTIAAFCAFTFAFGCVTVGGVLLVWEPGIVRRLFHVHLATVRTIGEGMLGFVALYVAGSALRLKPLAFGKFRLAYPALDIVLRQLVVGPLELFGAAGIIYFALPGPGNPGFFIVLAVFLASFSAALLSHAPGGLGVLEYVFLRAMPSLPAAKVLAALIVFRALYLIVPLIVAICIVVQFERNRVAQALRARHRDGELDRTAGRADNSERLAPSKLGPQPRQSSLRAPPFN